MPRSPGTASPFAPPVEDLIDLGGVRAFARRERLGQIEERVPRQISFPRRPFGESLPCGLLQGEPFGLRGPQDERIDDGIHLRLDDLLPTHRKRRGAWTIYMFSLHVSTGWRCAYRQEQPPTRSLLPPWILTIFVPERPGDPTESRGESEGEVDAIGDRVRSRHVAAVGLTDGTLTSLAAAIRHAVSARTNRFERAHRTLGR